MADGLQNHKFSLSFVRSVCTFEDVGGPMKNGRENLMLQTEDKDVPLSFLF